MNQVEITREDNAKWLELLRVLYTAIKKKVQFIQLQELKNLFFIRFTFSFFITWILRTHDRSQWYGTTKRYRNAIMQFKNIMENTSVPQMTFNLSM